MKNLDAWASELNVTKGPLIVLTGEDPFDINCWTEERESKARWFAEILEPHKPPPGGQVHLRRLHYTFLSTGIKKPDGALYHTGDKDWPFMMEASRIARNWRLVDPLSIVDKRNPPAKIFYQATEENRDARAVYTTGDLGLPSVSLSLPDFWFREVDFPELRIEGYQVEHPYFAEIWLEKETMDDVVEPIARRYGVNLIRAKGYPSHSAINDFLGRVRASGKPGRILYVSDFDPQGTTMPVAVARYIEANRDEYAPGADIAVKPIALTPEQVETYNIPRIEIKNPTKFKDWISRFGEGGAELDALEALHPGLLGKILCEELDSLFDPSLEGRVYEAKGDAMEECERISEEIVSPYRERVDRLHEEAKEIINGFRPQVNDLSRKIQAAVRPYNEELECIRTEITDRLREADLFISDCPEAEPEHDPDSWLFHSERDFLDQTRAYLVHTRRPFALKVKKTPPRRKKESTQPEARTLSLVSREDDDEDEE